MSKLCAFYGMALALLLVVASGCQSSGGPKSAVPAMAQRAIVVSGGNSGSTVVFIPSTDHDHVDVLATSGTQVCSTCQTMAVKYFQTGELVAKCPTCGATHTPVTWIPPASGHN